MNELLKELGFEHLPMLSEFVDELKAVAHGKCFSMDVVKYTDFITQPLTKGMFVPCDEDGNVLEKPLKCYCTGDIGMDCQTECGMDCEFDYKTNIKYQQANERVIFCSAEFDGFQLLDSFIDDGIKYSTIEQAINAGVKLKLK